MFLALTLQIRALYFVSGVSNRLSGRHGDKIGWLLMVMVHAKMAVKRMVPEMMIGVRDRERARI